MNILIKLTCLIGLVIAPILGGHTDAEAHETSKELKIWIDEDGNKHVLDSDTEINFYGDEKHVDKQVEVQMKKNSDGTVEATVTSTTTSNGKSIITEQLFKGTEAEVKAQIEALEQVSTKEQTPDISELQGVWVLDGSHSYVDFSIRHILATSKGSFKTVSGEFNFSKDNSSAAITIDVNSINTSNDKRDAHLKEDEYFGAEKFPAITFVANKITQTPHDVLLHGQLTIKDVTKEVLLPITYLGQQATPWGFPSAAFEGEITVNRAEFNVGEAGGLLGDDVKVSFSFELNPKKEDTK